MRDPLQDLEAERAFLGGLLALGYDPVAQRSALESSLVQPDRLTHPAHQALLASIYELTGAGSPVDPVTLRRSLAKTPAFESAGGATWLAELEGSVPTTANLSHYADAIREAALRRKIIEIAAEASRAARDPGVAPAEALSKASGAMASISLSKRSIKSLSEVLDEALQELEERMAGKESGPIPTGIAGLDAVIGGLQRSVLTVVGALPGTGKSALLAAICQGLAKSNVKVGLFSLEDDAKWLAYRLWSDEAGVNQFVLRNRLLTQGQQESASRGVSRISKYANNVLVDDRGGLSPSEVTLTARDMIVNRGCRAIVLDHLGELRLGTKHKDRHDLEIADALADLRDIAKRHSIPVIVASQLKNRQGLGPGDDPTINDFANSSEIGRKARVAIGLAREGNSDTIRVSVLKNTNGVAGKTVELRFAGAAAMVKDCEGNVADYYKDAEPET
jgi:replicative DNA helicase